MPLLTSIMAASRRRVDPDAADYFARIAAAGSTISEPNKVAVNAFVVGCKADGIWNAIKASCLLAGPDDLTGALVPLVGAAPTNFNFVAGDCNRVTGLVGDGSTKYLGSNRNNNADPQDNQHLAVFPYSIGTSGPYVGMIAGVGTGALNVGRTLTRSRNSSAVTYANSPSSGSLIGVSRASSSGYSVRSAGITTPVTQSSQSPADSEILIGAWVGISTFGNARLSFYSIGESLDLALLDARLTTYMSALT
jgi:hypothetical protein